MSGPTLNLFLQPIPPNTPPSMWIRRVDSAIVAGLLTLAFVDALVGWALWRPLLGAPVPDGGLLHQLLAYPGVLLAQVSGGHLAPHAVVDNPAALNVWPLHARLLPALALGMAAGAYVLKAGLHPWRRMRHLDGPQLLEGKNAVRAARQVAAVECAKEPPFMDLHPELPLPKSRWTRGVLMYGSPGSGKTVSLIPIVQQLLAGAHRTLIYDAKGDFTSYWLGGSVGLLCPWDRRSLVWDIGRDLRTPSQAQTFASSLIPDEEGNGKFWSTAARQLLEGTLRGLQNELGTNWGWSTLGDRLAAAAPVFAASMAEHYPKAVALVADEKSQTTGSVLATLSAYTKLIDDLALAWGDGRDSAGHLRPSIAFSDWAADGYAGKVRQIILQAGADRTATTALASAIINTLTPALLSAALPDDEKGRTVAFVLDELPSLGKIDFAGLIERGRSKGVIFVGACQTLDQIKAVWGEETMRSLGSMIGTHLIFRCQPSASRDAIAEQFGKSRWAITAVNTTGGGGQQSGTNTSVHEETRPVIQPSELTSILGPRPHKAFALGWGVRAMVSLGGDVLTLDFPGVSPEKRRTPHRPARWTLGPVKPNAKPTTTTTAAGAGDRVEVKAQEAHAEPKPAGRKMPRTVSRTVTRKPGQPGEPLFYWAENPLAQLEPDAPKGRTIVVERGAIERIHAERESSPLASLAAGAAFPGIEPILHAAEIIDLIQESVGTPETDSRPVALVQVGPAQDR
jgi:hypothetical protein